MRIILLCDRPCYGSPFTRRGRYNGKRIGRRQTRLARRFDGKMFSFLFYVTKEKGKLSLTFFDCHLNNFNVVINTMFELELF